MKVDAVAQQQHYSHWCETHKRECGKHGCESKGGILLPCRVIEVDWITAPNADHIDLGLRSDGVVVWRRFE